MEKKSFVCNVSYDSEKRMGSYSVEGENPREIAIHAIKILAKAYNIDLTIMNEWDVFEDEM